MRDGRHTYAMRARRTYLHSKCTFMLQLRQLDSPPIIVLRQYVHAVAPACVRARVCVWTDASQGQCRANQTSSNARMVSLHRNKHPRTIKKLQHAHNVLSGPCRKAARAFRHRLLNDRDNCDRAKWQTPASIQMGLLRSSVHRPDRYRKRLTHLCSCAAARRGGRARSGGTGAGPGRGGSSGAPGARSSPRAAAVSVLCRGAAGPP